MSDEMAERTVGSVAALRGATERSMARAARGWWGAAASETIVALFEELGLDAPVIYADGRVEWVRDDG